MPRELLTMTGTYAQFEGTEIVAENCLGTKVRDLVIKGKTYQNLFNATLNQGHINGASDYQNRRINSDGFTLDSTTYTISVPSGYLVLVYPNYVGWIGENITWANKIVWTNSTTSNNIRIMICKVDDGELTVDEVIGKVILLKGDYTNIDLPNSINGIESVAEMDKNLVNTATIYEGKRESGSVGSLFHPITDSLYTIYMMKIQPNTEYLLNLDGYGQAPWVRFLDENYTIVKSGNASASGLSYTWSVKSGNNYYYLEFNKPKSFTGTFRVYKKENEYPLKLAVNEEINFINLPIPLRSLPNGTCDTIENNQLIQRVGKIVIDGTQSFILNNVNQSKTTRCYFTLDNANISKGNNNLICNWYIREGKHGDYEYIIIQSIAEETSNTVFISVLNSKLETRDVNGMKKYFSENPLPVYYELTTPITHSLEIPSINTVSTTNTITTSNNIKPVISCKLKLSKASITS